MGTRANIFDSIADNYQRGELDHVLDRVFLAAASDGIVLLPGEGRPYAHSKCGSYEVADLLLPFDINIWHSISNAFNGGISPYPEWFTYNNTYNNNDGWFEYTQEDFLAAFIKAKKLTKHKGKFYTNGNPISDNDIKNAIRKSLSIVRADAGKLICGAFNALSVMIQDDAPEVKRTSLSCAALTNEMNRCGYGVRYNTISADFEAIGETPSKRPMTLDDLEVILRDSLSDTYKGVTSERIKQSIAFVGRENRYNPVLEYISAVHWDGIDRFPQLYKLIGISDDDKISRILLQKWSLQSVALLFNQDDDPFGAEGCIVFTGPQSLGKTTLLRRLAISPKWFSEGCSIDDHDKDTIRRIITRWIAELGEVESTLKSDINKLKAFITASTDRYRLPYGAHDIDKPRHTSLAATCNGTRYLIDQTGNRRWWTVPFTRRILREELLGFDANQFWAQVYSIVSPMSYKEKSTCFRLTPEEQAMLAERNNNYEKQCKGQAEIEDILAKAFQEKLIWEEMTASEFIAEWPILQRYSAQEIGIALRRCGFEAKRENGTGKRMQMLPTQPKVSVPFSDKKPEE